MISISASEAPWRELNGLLQRGVWCRASTPAPLGAFLTEQLGLEDDYVRSRIETIFLDGLVVDDLDGSTVHDGSTVTLSAAMPGLVGATLRRGGFYKSMRREISWSASSHDGPAGGAPTGLVRVKLFNLVLREAGPKLLRRGVLVDRSAATEALGPAFVGAMPDVDGRVLIGVDDGTPAGDMPVHVIIKLFATFRKDRFAIREDALPVGTRVRDVVVRLGIEPADVGVIMANGRHVELDHELRPDDVLAIFPVIGGG